MHRRRADPAARLPLQLAEHMAHEPRHLRRALHSVEALARVAQPVVGTVEEV